MICLLVARANIAYAGGIAMKSGKRLEEDDKKMKAAS
jgi:hypothetical protein